MQLDKPYLKVTYNGKNITADVSRSLTSFTYTDNLSEADTLDIELEDADEKWQNEWYPEKGATITAGIGIAGGITLDCGEFEIDEIELTGAPDSVSIRCIAAGFKKGQKRSRKSHVHEGKTLAEIVRTIASTSGLMVQGKVSDIRFGRAVQRKETDLRFLHRLAKQYGFTYNIRGNKLIFISNEDLESAKAVRVFKKNELLSFSLRDKSTNTYKSASIKFHNPETDETVEHKETEGGSEDTDDNLELKYTAETQAQARMMTKAALREANKLQQSGSVSLPGSPLLCSGNVIRLNGLGLLSGDYIIKSSAHSIANDTGWIVDAEIYKVGFIEKDDSNAGGDNIPKWGDLENLINNDSTNFIHNY